MKLSTLSTILFVSTLSVLGKVQTPTFERLFNGIITIGFSSSDIIVGPFGKRVQASITGGNLTDPTSGKVVANIVPAIGGEVGLIAADGAFFPDIRLTAQWIGDSKLAYLSVRGVGVAQVTSALYFRVETDSPKYSYLNDKFIVGNVTFPAGGTGSSADLGIFVLKQ